MEVIYTDSDVAHLQPYDIVRLTAEDEDLNGQTAYISRLPNDRSSHYVLWIPDLYTVLTHRPGGQDSRIQSFVLDSSAPSASLLTTLAVEAGSLLAGTPRVNPRDIHTLRVVRVDGNDIYVTRTNDIAETVVRIPLESGIGDDSPYVFLRPGVPVAPDRHDDIPPSVVAGASLPKRSKEAEEELRRLAEGGHVKILYDKLPAYRLMEETIVKGGTRDVERIRGQVVSAIAALDVRNEQEYSADAERIRDLIIHETRQGFFGREDTREGQEPILLRRHEDASFPSWVIPVDSSRADETLPVTEVPPEKEGGEPKLEGIVPPEIPRELSRNVYSRYVNETALPYRLSMGGDTENPASYEVVAPQSYVLTNGAPIVSHDAISTAGEVSTGGATGPVVIRRALPSAPVPIGEPLRGADSIVPAGALTFSLRGYAPPDAPLVERYATPITREQWIDSTGSTGEPSEEPPAWTPRITPTAIQGAVEILPPHAEAGVLLNRMGSIPREIGSSRQKILQLLSIPLESLLPVLPSTLAGGMDELETFLKTFGYSREILNHRERLMLSELVKIRAGKLKDRLDTLPVTREIVLPNPTSLFKGRKGLQKAYPETFGLIGTEEAFYRVMEAPGDYGRLLYTINSINEYSEIRDDLENAVEESRNKRSEIRERMAKIQEELHQLEGALRTMPKVAKHFQGKNEVEADNKLATTEGKLPLWDPSLDDDPLRFLYNGDRIQKITGALLSKLQDEGELEFPRRATDDEPTAEDVCAPSFANIPEDRLLEEVRADIRIYNENLPPERQMNDARMETIVRRVILGGRPVEDGDHALITRHLRTAAFVWSADVRRWTPVREDTMRVVADDVSIDSVREGTASKTATVYSKTLTLNKEYRQLSKLRDDLELLQNRPGITSDPEQMRKALDLLFKRGETVYEKRRQYVSNNRVLDELPFVHDHLGVLLRRSMGGVDDSLAEDTRADLGGEEEEGAMGVPQTAEGPVATRSDLRKALFKNDELVTDIEQALFEAGITSYAGAREGEVTRAQQGGGEAIGDDAPELPAFVISDDPRVVEAAGRTGSATYVFEAPKPQQPRRYFLATIGFAELLFRVPLTTTELSIAVSEADVILGKSATPESSCMRGLAMYMLLLMTRMEGEVHFYTTEGIAPPMPRGTLPSYLMAPLDGGEDTRMIDFVESAVVSSIQKTMAMRAEAETEAEAGRGSVGALVMGVLQKSALVKDESRRRKEKSKGASSSTTEEGAFYDTSVQIARSSPSIVNRAFVGMEGILRRSTPGMAIRERMLRLVEDWETLPVGYRPHNKGLPIKEGSRLLKGEPLLLTDPFGVPYRANASLPSSIRAPELEGVLRSMGRERADTMLKIFYGKETGDSRGSGWKLGHSIVYGLAKEYVGIQRERATGPRVSRAEAPLTIQERLTPLESFKEFGGEGEEGAKAGTRGEGKGEGAVMRRAEELMRDILRESKLGQLREGEVEIPVKAFERTGNGEQTRESEDANGSLRAELIAFHDAAVLAAEWLLREREGRPRPTSVEKTDIASGPIYSAYNLITRMYKGVPPQRIEHSASVLPGKGGSHMAVLTGEGTYYSLVSSLKLMLPDKGISTAGRIREFLRMCRAIRTLILELPPRAPRAYTLSAILEILDRESGADSTDDQFAAVDAYVGILGDRYVRGGKTQETGIYDDLRMTAGVFTDVTMRMMQEEANKDRENERQRFIYQLEKLDPERRKVVRAARLLGLDLAGKVARDPKKFNAEYYQIQTGIVAEQQMKDRMDETAMADPTQRTSQFGDAMDIMEQGVAIEEAPGEVDQIEGLDYD
jgi:hypothetical protein